MQEKPCKNAEAKVIFSEGPQRDVWNQLQLGFLSGPIEVLNLFQLLYDVRSNETFATSSVYALWSFLISSSRR